MGLYEKTNSMFDYCTRKWEENGTKLENILQDIVQENFLNLERQDNIQVQEIQRISQRYSSRRATPRHIIIRFTKVEMKEKILRAAREKVGLPTKGSPSDSQQISWQKPYKPEESWGQYSTSLKKELSTQNFISSQTKLHKWKKNKILCEQASTQKFCYHQACFTRAPERGTTHRKEQPVPAIPKSH